jgi:hypothetical protein
MVTRAYILRFRRLTEAAVFVHISAVEKAGYSSLQEGEGELRRRFEPRQGIGRKFEDPLNAD